MHLAQTVTVLRLTDELLTQESLRVAQRYLEEPAVSVIHLDLAGVKLPTADGLGALVILNKELRARGGALVLFNVAAAVHEVFVLTQLVKVLEVRANSPSWRHNNDIPVPQVVAKEFS